MRSIYYQEQSVGIHQ